MMEGEMMMGEKMEGEEMMAEGGDEMDAMMGGMMMGLLNPIVRFPVALIP